MTRRPRTPSIVPGWHLETGWRRPHNWRVFRPDGVALRRTFSSVSLAIDAMNAATSQLAMFGATS